MTLMDALWVLPEQGDGIAVPPDGLTPFEQLQAGDVILYEGGTSHVVYREASALWLEHGYGWTVCHVFDALTCDERVRVTGWQPVDAAVVKSIETLSWRVCIGEVK